MGRQKLFRLITKVSFSSSISVYDGNYSGESCMQHYLWQPKWAMVANQKTITLITPPPRWISVQTLLGQCMTAITMVIVRIFVLISCMLNINWLISYVEHFFLPGMWLGTELRNYFWVGGHIDSLCSWHNLCLSQSLCRIYSGIASERRWSYKL